VNNILDEDEIKELIDKRVKNPLKVALFDLILLFIINFIFVLIYEWSLFNPENSIDIVSYLYNSAIFSCLFILLSSFLESVKFLYRTLRKSKNEKVIVLLDPFWLQVIEGSLGSAIILYGLTLLFYAIAFIFIS